MIDRRAFIGAAIFGGTLLLGGCATSYPTYRYRLKVEVDTPLGLRTGTSVIEIRTVENWQKFNLAPGSVGKFMTGEAVIIDLPDGQPLFALLQSEDDSEWAEGAFSRMIPPYEGKTDDERFRKTMERLYVTKQEMALPRQWTYGKGRAQLAMDGYPLLARFRDTREPTSVERVDPDDLASTFGKGFRIRRITVQLTNDPITRQIRSRLPWLAAQRGSLVPWPSDASRNEVGFASLLNEGSFERTR